MIRAPRSLFVMVLIQCCLWTVGVQAVNYPYDGSVSHNVKRDRILAISEDYASLSYYCNSSNIDYSSYTGATCPDPTIGWKTGMKYCWGGEDTTAQYLLKMTQGDGAGNKNTSSSSSYDSYCAGADCSGFASNAWTSPRHSTASFHNISTNIGWEDLRAGDALNNAGSHIRIFDYYISNVGTSMLYESTSGGGILWKNVQRSLSRDNNYQPIRYSSTYSVVSPSEPDITYVKNTGVERVEFRWDGEADIGFRIYSSFDGISWGLLRDTSQLDPTDRYCELSGLLPDKTYYLKMTAVNSGGESNDSDVVACRIDSDDSRVVLIDGYDRYNDQHSGSCHTLLQRYALALEETGVGFEYCTNEAIVDRQVVLNDYEIAVWMVGEDSTFDESLSWAEQMHIQNFLAQGGNIFISGSEIGWDLDHKGDSGNTWKNGTPNDTTFYNNYLLSNYNDDDANTYQVSGSSGSIFDGLSFFFDDGSHGTYNVAYPDVISTHGGAQQALEYVGGLGGTAAVYGTSGSGKIIYLAFPFETIYPAQARADIMREGLRYFTLSTAPPTLKTCIEIAAGSVSITWAGYASEGFRLFQKVDEGAWVQIKNESELTSSVHYTTLTGLTIGAAYAFKIQAINDSVASGDSDVLVCSPRATGNTILVVDGYDRWNDQFSTNHTLMEIYASAFGSNSLRFESCSNEALTDGGFSLTDYDIVFWMCGEESTESETLSSDEQILLEEYLKEGGNLFISGAEIGWDLVHKADTSNDFSNGHPNDNNFYTNYLKATFLSDDANTYSAQGVPGGIFAGLSMEFDDGTQGTYNVRYPDVISIYGGSNQVLYYGTSGTDVAAVAFSGIFSGGSTDGALIYMGFPFETIYNSAVRQELVEKAIDYFSSTEIGFWLTY